MTISQLDFECTALQLESHVRNLSGVQAAARVDLTEEIGKLHTKVESALRHAYCNLSAWQIAKVARHADRPHALDYIGALFSDFVELHGDRAYADDAALVGGLACLDGRPLVVLGHEKGRNAKERVQRNFGMPRPEGYRKAIRLMTLAERFQLPLVTLIDTPGAFPGIDAEERGQSAAIGESIYRMSQLQVPTVSIVIGEGGSGGALAIGVADVVCMLEYATYSVISPEGCASILWKDSAQAEMAANALGITAARLRSLQLIDEVIAEPVGGAHRDPAAAADLLKTVLRRVLAELTGMPPSTRHAMRQAKLRACGAFQEPS